MAKGDIVLVPYPYDDLSGTKTRPVLCLTDALGIYRHIITAFITSQVPSDLLDSDLVLHTKHSDFATTGLRVSSTIRLHRLFAFPSANALRRLGTITALRQTEVSDKLRALLDL